MRQLLVLHYVYSRSSARERAAGARARMCVCVCVCACMGLFILFAGLASHAVCVCVRVPHVPAGGSKEQIEKMREVVELPMLHPEKFVALGIDPPKVSLRISPAHTSTSCSCVARRLSLSHNEMHRPGCRAKSWVRAVSKCVCVCVCHTVQGVLMYGPPGTGKTLLARAVANRTDACFIRVIGSELVQKYVGEGARMVRELFQMARSKKVRVLSSLCHRARVLSVSKGCSNL